LPKEPENGYSSYSRDKDFEVITCLSNILGKTRDFLEKGYGLVMDDLNA
jgi:hypothetical protein